jgi:hypothetical protein
MQQRVRGRISLVQDARYSLAEAPKAWRLIDLKEGKNLAERAIPNAAIYAYAILRSTWRQSIGQ